MLCILVVHYSVLSVLYCYPNQPYYSGVMVRTHRYGGRVQCPDYRVTVLVSCPS